MNITTNYKSNYNNFRHLSFEERMRFKDTTSHRAFNNYCKANNIQPLKFGFDGSEKYKPYHTDTTLRNAPDKLCLLPSGGYVLTELKGCGNNGVRIKCSSMAQYLEWAKLFSLFVFVYNSTMKKYAYLSIMELAAITELVGSAIDKSMGEIFHIPCEMLEWTNLPIIHEPQYADNYLRN